MLEIFFPYYDRDIIASKDIKQYSLKPIETIPSSAGIPLNHQIIIKHLMSSYSPINSMLLIHEMGTGKTCTAIQCIEQHLRETQSFQQNIIPNSQTFIPGPGLSGAIILTRGQTLMKNFQSELLFKCTDGRYIGSTKNQSHKLISKNYSFYTFEIFAKSLAKLSDNTIVNSFSNKFIVIDEAHNIREDTVDKNLDIYGQIHRFLHLVKNKKILLLTGTPMKDSPEEIAALLNLILPADLQLATGKSFRQKYFANSTETAYSKMTNIEQFKLSISASPDCAISVLDAIANPRVKKVQMGKRLGSLKFIKIVPHIMDEFQTDVFNIAIKKDSEESSIYLNSRQASRFVFPDKSWGSSGFKKNIIEKQGHFRMSSEFAKFFSNAKSTNDILERIKILSVKYAAIIQNILDACDKGENTLVYDDLVKGSGLIVFSLLLELFGFSKNTGTANASKTYCVLSNETSSVAQIMKLQKIFNSFNNRHGQIMPVIMGSRVIAEGLSFNNIIHEHVVPHWNNSETSQVIARGWRVASHNDLYDDLHTNRAKSISMYIYRHASFVKSVGKKIDDLNINSIQNIPKISIDFEMYRVAERKDFEIYQVIRCLREKSIDCSLFYERNKKDSSFDDTKECDYQKCAYKCDLDLSETQRDSQIVLDNETSLYFAEKQKLLYSLILKFFANYHYGSINHIIFYIKNTMDLDAQIFKYYISDIDIQHMICLFVMFNIPVYNKFHFQCFLNISYSHQVQIVYCTLNVLQEQNIQKNPDFNNSINPKISPLHFNYTEWYLYILKQLNENKILELVSSITTNNYKQVLTQLRPDIQEKILEKAIVFWYYEKLDVNKNLKEKIMNRKKIREFILDYYKSFYKIYDKVAISWLQTDIEKKPERCLYTYARKFKNTTQDELEFRSNDWTDCKKQERDTIDQEKIEKKKPFETKLGYYGIVNPQLNEFCIRDLTIKPLKKNDKRAILSGKRCINWTKLELTHLVAFVLRISPSDDINTGYTIPNANNALEFIKKNKFLKKMVGSGNNSKALLVRVAYWYSHTRESLCANIKNWFQKNNLLDQDFSCGAQIKKKV
jgi:hypothetical protein